MPKGTLLLVEDHEANREMMRRLLILHGFDVMTASDGHQAIELTLAHHPELILMDMNLPGINGWEAARLLKKQSCIDIPIIALTAHALAEEKQRALSAGCDEFEIKPVEMDKLVRKITRLMGRP